jgi:ribose transport system substrate-binding protein
VKGEIEMKKIFLIIIMVVLFSITLVGYGQAQEGKYEVAVIVKATSSDFWQYVIIGAENAAKDNPAIHVTTYGPPSEADMDKQLSILEDVISRKPDGIVISSTSSDATVPALEQAYDAGIKIVTIDNKVKTDKVHSFLATDNVEGGGKIAQELVDGLKAKGIPLKGKVGFISAMAGVQVLIDRAKGFTDKLKELAPDLEIIGPRYVDNDVLKALSTAEDILTAHSDVVGFFADNNSTGDGLARVIIERKLSDKIVAVAFDSDPEEIKALESGVLKALLLQDPYGMGYKGVMSVFDAIQGKTLPKYINTGSTVATKENMKQPEILALLDPTLKKK